MQKNMKFDKYKIGLQPLDFYKIFWSLNLSKSPTYKLFKSMYKKNSNNCRPFFKSLKLMNTIDKKYIYDLPLA